MEHRSYSHADRQPTPENQAAPPLPNGEELVWLLIDLDAKRNEITAQIRAAVEQFSTDLCAATSYYSAAAVSSQLSNVHRGYEKDNVRGAIRRLAKNGCGIRNWQPDPVPEACSQCGVVFLGRGGMCPSCVVECNRLNRERAERQDAQRANYEEQVRILKSMPYDEYLQTEHWKETRQRALKRAWYKCQLCNRGNTRLDVHHRTYERRGEELAADVIVLCRPCHETHHKAQKETPQDNEQGEF